MSRSAKLEEYLRGRPESHFDWASANCCQFVSVWIHDLTGEDPMAAMNLRSTRTEFDARRLIVELGGSLKAAWTRALGREPNSANFAQVGDLVLMDLPGGGGSVGICCGRDAVYLDAAGGLARLPMTLASHAWKIGGAAC